MPEWAPGLLAARLKQIQAAGRANQRRGLLLIAAAIEAKAKTELGRSSHRHGTRSPAAKGGPPSLVTGTARRSIGHEYLPERDPVVKIGTIAGIFPPALTSSTGKGTRSRASAGTTGQRGGTPSSKYLLYQEKDPQFDHPFLLPSFRSVITQSAPKIWLESFRSWPRL